MLLRKAIPVKFLSRERDRELNVNLLTSASELLTGGYGFKPLDAHRDRQCMIRSWAKKLRCSTMEGYRCLRWRGQASCLGSRIC
jgi:hypothetical protein